MGHRAEKCPYKVRAPVRDGGVEDVGKKVEVQSQPASKEEDAFRPWVPVIRKRQPYLKQGKDKA